MATCLEAHLYPIDIANLTPDNLGGELKKATRKQRGYYLLALVSAVAVVAAAIFAFSKLDLQTFVLLGLPMLSVIGYPTLYFQDLADTHFHRAAALQSIHKKKPRTPDALRLAHQEIVEVDIKQGLDALKKILDSEKLSPIERDRFVRVSQAIRRAVVMLTNSASQTELLGRLEPSMIGLWKR